VALAFDEIATNIVKYGQPKEDVELVVRLGDETILTFEDDGVAFDPRGQAAPPVPARRRDLRIGGLGLVLIRHFSSHIDYTRTPDHRNRLTVAIPPRR
jgi:anti-sigma regulatory factor (Ser/Thr protein kinase)